MSKDVSPVRSIRKYCVQVCQSGSPKEARHCSNSECPLFPFRMGTNPNRQGIGGHPSFLKNNQLESPKTAQKGASNA